MSPPLRIKRRESSEIDSVFLYKHFRKNSGLLRQNALNVKRALSEGLDGE